MINKEPISLESRSALFDNDGTPTIESGKLVSLENYAVRRLNGPWIDLIDQEGGVLPGRLNRPIEPSHEKHVDGVTGKIRYHASTPNGVYIEIKDVYYSLVK